MPEVPNNLNGSSFEVKTWEDYLVTTEPPEEPVLLKIGNTPVWSAASHSLIVGKKKSRKSLLLTWMISQYEGDIERDILIADTEQGLKHVWKTRDRVFRLTGKRVHILSLKGENTQRRRDVIEQAISTKRFKIILIDGCRDLLSNINDPDQCTELVTWIEIMTVNYNVHVCNVLHLNKTDNNARGHIGSELLNKAEITIELELDPKANCTLVKCESSRDVPFETFAFGHDERGLPALVSIPIKGQALSEWEQKERLQFVFEGNQLKWHEVIEGIKAHFEVGTVKARTLLAHYDRIGWIVKNGRDRSPDTVYKLMVTVLKPAYHS